MGNAIPAATSSPVGRSTAMATPPEKKRPGRFSLKRLRRSSKGTAVDVQDVQDVQREGARTGGNANEEDMAEIEVECGPSTTPRAGAGGRSAWE